MRRREFITLLGGAAAWPLMAQAQQPTIPVIGLLGSATANEWTPYVKAFHQGLRDAGYVEGDNVAIEARWANSQYERLPAMAAELVQRHVTVIAAFSTTAAHAAHAATATIPIVFTTNRDPVQIGFVTSLARPGGNMTGATNLSLEVGPKLLELLHEAIPTAKIVALLVNPTDSKCRDPVEKPASTRPHIRHATSCLECQHRRRFRYSVCDFAPTESRRADDRQRCILDCAQQTTGCTGGPPCCACDFPEPRVCSSRRSDELHGQHSGYVPSGWSLHGPDS